MKRFEAANHRKLRPTKLSSKEVPHAVIESNYTCNRRCRFCYVRSRDGVKPLGQIKSEIDLALTLRNIETLSILGGEPTLHPDLVEIVRYIKGKNVVCQILSNGVRLMKPGGDLLLDGLIRAGLDRIVLHVDNGQGLTPVEVDRMRNALFAKFEERKLSFGMTVAITDEELDKIPEIMQHYAHFRYCDGILATIARSEEAIAGGVNHANGSPELLDVYTGIQRGLRIEPSSYIPSNLDDEEMRWLVYFYYYNFRTKTSVSISPAFGRLMRRGYRLITGRNLFACRVNPSFSKFWFLFTLVAETFLAPSSVPLYVRVAKESHGLRDIRFHSITLQSLARLNVQKQRLEICYHCPDATIRDGKLVPVCIADWLRPRIGQPLQTQDNDQAAEIKTALAEEAI